MSQYQELFEYLLDEHDIVCVESDLQEIERIVLDMHEEKSDICPTCDSDNTYRTIAIHCNRCACNSEI